MSWRRRNDGIPCGICRGDIGAMTRGKYTRKPGNPYGRKPDAEQDAATLQAIADLLELGQKPTPQAVRNVLAQRGIEKSRL